MNARFSRLAPWLMMACCQCLHAQSEPTGLGTGTQLLQAAAHRVAKYRTIEAKLRVTTDALGQPLVGSGVYAQLQATSGLLLRLELSMQAGGKASSVKQICNGHTLWEHWQFGNQQKLNHVDLKRVAKELAKTTDPPSVNATASLVRGGLPKVLAQLDRHFDFGRQPVQGVHLSQVKTWVVAGTWRPSQLKKICPAAVNDAGIDYQALPSHLPHAVQLVLGQTDLFPYRLTYSRYASDDSGTLTPIVTTDFFDVALDDPLDPSQFDYRQPDNISVADRTELFLRSLGVDRQPTLKR